MASAAASNSSTRDRNEFFDADFKEDFNQGMLRMLSQGSSNDVRIILSDGEITANKDVLAVQCECFAANFRWKKETKDDFDHIDNRDCSKKVMERIIKFLFTGTIRFKDLGILQLVELLNQVKKLLLCGNLQFLIKSYIKDDVLSLETLQNKNNQNSNMFIDVIRGLHYVDRYALDCVKSSMIRGLGALLNKFSRDNEAISAFSILPCHIVEELFSRWSRLSRKKASPRIQTLIGSAQFRCLLALCNQNKDLSQEDKKKILETIDLDSLSGADLFQLVKASGLFPRCTFV